METPYPVYFDQALNCARILSRILPFMLETDSQSVRELFWNKQIIPKVAASAVEDDAKEDGGGGIDESRNGAASNEEDVGEDLQETEPLAVILVNSIFHLLFLPGKE